MTDLFKFNTRSTSLLKTDEFRDAVLKALEVTQKELFVFSGYVTLNGVEWLKKFLPDNIDCIILTKWDEQTICKSETYIKACEYAMANGWSFRLYDEFHAKIFRFDNQYVAVGSNNLTGPGFGLLPISNIETGVMKEINDDDISVCDAYINKSRLMTDEELVIWKDYFKEHKHLTKDKISYPKIKIPLKKERIIETNELWFDQFPLLSYKELSTSTKQDADVEHDLNLLGISHFDKKLIEEKFTDTYIFLWLKKVLQERTDERTYNFGKLSEIIHNNLLDDVRVWRKDVKGLLHNLFTYIEEFNYKDFKIVRYERTKTIDLS